MKVILIHVVGLLGISSQGNSPFFVLSDTGEARFSSSRSGICAFEIGETRVEGIRVRKAVLDRAERPSMDTQLQPARCVSQIDASDCLVPHRLVGKRG